MQYIYDYDKYNEYNNNEGNIIIIEIDEKTTYYRIARELLIQLYGDKFSDKLWKGVDVIIVTNLESIKNSGKEITLKRYAGPNGHVEAPELLSGHSLHIDIDFLRQCCDSEDYEFKFLKNMNTY